MAPLIFLYLHDAAREGLQPFPLVEQLRGHVRDQQKWADVTRRATVAIAGRERTPRLTGLQETQSIFYAMTEVCKGQPASFEPSAGSNVL